MASGPSLPFTLLVAAACRMLLAGLSTFALLVITTARNIEANRVLEAIKRIFHPSPSPSPPPTPVSPLPYQVNPQLSWLTLIRMAGVLLNIIGVFCVHVVLSVLYSVPFPTDLRDKTSGWWLTQRISAMTTTPGLSAPPPSAPKAAPTHAAAWFLASALRLFGIMAQVARISTTPAPSIAAINYAPSSWIELTRVLVYAYTIWECLPSMVTVTLSAIATPGWVRTLASLFALLAFLSALLPSVIRECACGVINAIHLQEVVNPSSEVDKTLCQTPSPKKKLWIFFVDDDDVPPTPPTPSRNRRPVAPPSSPPPNEENTASTAFDDVSGPAVGSPPGGTDSATDLAHVIDGSIGDNDEDRLVTVAEHLHETVEAANQALDDTFSLASLVSGEVENLTNAPDMVVCLLDVSVDDEEGFYADERGELCTRMEAVEEAVMEGGERELSVKGMGNQAFLFDEPEKSEAGSFSDLRSEKMARPVAEAPTETSVVASASPLPRCRLDLAPDSPNVSKISTSPFTASERSRCFHWIQDVRTTETASRIHRLSASTADLGVQLHVFGQRLRSTVYEINGEEEPPPPPPCTPPRPRVPVLKVIQASPRKGPPLTPPPAAFKFPPFLEFATSFSIASMATLESVDSLLADTSLPDLTRAAKRYESESLLGSAWPADFPTEPDTEEEWRLTPEMEAFWAERVKAREAANPSPPVDVDALSVVGDGGGEECGLDDWDYGFEGCYEEEEEEEECEPGEEMMRRLGFEAVVVSAPVCNEPERVLDSPLHEESSSYSAGSMDVAVNTISLDRDDDEDEQAEEAKSFLSLFASFTHERWESLWTMYLGREPAEPPQTPTPHSPPSSPPTISKIQLDLNFSPLPKGPPPRAVRSKPSSMAVPAPRPRLSAPSKPGTRSVSAPIPTPTPVPASRVLRPRPSAPTPSRAPAQARAASSSRRSLPAAITPSPSPSPAIRVRAPAQVKVASSRRSLPPPANALSPVVRTSAQAKVASSRRSLPPPAASASTTPALPGGAAKSGTRRVSVNRPPALARR